MAQGMNGEDMMRLRRAVQSDRVAMSTSESSGVAEQLYERPLNNRGNQRDCSPLSVSSGLGGPPSPMTSLKLTIPSVLLHHSAAL